MEFKLKSNKWNSVNNQTGFTEQRRNERKSLNCGGDKSEIGRTNLLFDNLEKDELLTAENLAERLNIAVKTVRKWRYEGVLPSDSMVKLRHQVRYRWGSVLVWLSTKGAQ